MVSDVEHRQRVPAPPAAPEQAEAAEPAGRGGGGAQIGPSHRPPRARPGWGPKGRRPRAPSRDCGALRRGPASGDCLSQTRSGIPRTAVWCLTVHVPVTLGIPGRGSRPGTGCPYPHPRAAIPGAALRAWECARTEVALPEFRESGTLPFLHQRLVQFPLPVTIPCSCPSLLLPLKATLLWSPGAWVLILGFLPQVLAIPR